ncbi:MAG: TIGR01620 family protein [Hyphomicrobiales bacterium]
MTKPPTKPRRPRAQLLNDARLVEAPEHLPTITPPEIPQPAVTPPPRRFSFARLFWGSLTGLASLAFGLWLDGLITDLFARSQWLGYGAIALTGLLCLALLAMAVRELSALARLKSVHRLQARAAKTFAANDLIATRSLVKDILPLYEGRPETAQARNQIKAQLDNVMDGRDLMGLTERDLLGGMDAKASAIILSSSKRTSIVTAISPRALIDVLFVIVENMRLIRRLSQLYGGRPGFFSSWRLTREVIGHLVLTGGISAGDSMIQDALGHGLAAKVSARLGEGVINGMLTARVGRAAMTVCRPLPFLTSKPPSLKSIVGELTKGATDKQVDPE